MKWFKKLFGGGNHNISENLKDVTVDKSFGMDCANNQNNWATNAPFHWPKITLNELNSMGVSEGVTADPFELAAFAVQLKESFNAIAANCSIKEIRPEEYGEGIDFIIEDTGESVPVVLYPRGGVDAMHEYFNLTDRLVSEGYAAPIYFAPVPFDYSEQASVLPSSKVKASKQSFDILDNNLFPRVVAPDFLQRFPANAGLIVQALGNTGLLIVLVLDRDDAMAFLTEELLNQLEMTSDEAFTVALENLSNKKPDDVVRGVLENNQLMSVKMQDGFDAARILTIPRLLRDDESVAAIIPDRDTLVLLAVSADKDAPEFWESLVDFPCASNDSPPITNRPLKVTRHGIELR